MMIESGESAQFIEKKYENCRNWLPKPDWPTSQNRVIWDSVILTISLFLPVPPLIGSSSPSFSFPQPSLPHSHTRGIIPLLQIFQEPSKLMGKMPILPSISIVNNFFVITPFHERFSPTDSWDPLLSNYVKKCHETYKDLNTSPYNFVWSTKSIFVFLYLSINFYNVNYNNFGKQIFYNFSIQFS